MKRIIVLFILVAFSQISFSQISKITIGINGLTCSQCSRSVAIKLEQDDQVKSVEMDLEETFAYVTLKDNNKIDFEQLAKDVKAAGFSVRSIDVDYTIENTENIDIVKIGSKTIWLDKKIPQDTSKITFRLLGKTFNANKKENRKLKTFSTLEKNKENNYVAMLK